MARTAVCPVCKQKVGVAGNRLAWHTFKLSGVAFECGGKGEVAPDDESYDLLVELAREVAKEYPDSADWKDARGRLSRMAERALAGMEAG